MANLSQLLAPSIRPAVVADLSATVEEIVGSQSGITGMALKGAVAAAKRIDSNIVPKGLNKLLPELLGELDSYWQEFEASDQQDFGTYLEPRADEVTDGIMAVADRNAEQINNAPLAKTYSSLRGKASKIVEPHIPELARVLQKHM